MSPTMRSASDNDGAQQSSGFANKMDRLKVFLVDLHEDKITPFLIRQSNSD